MSIGQLDEKMDQVFGSLQTKEEKQREIEKLKDLLHKCLLQLEYLDSKNPTGTTPTLILKIKSVLCD